MARPNKQDKFLKKQMNGLQEIKNQIIGAANEAASTTTQEDIESMNRIPSAQAPNLINENTLKDFWKMAIDARNQWNAQKKRLEIAEKRTNEIIAEHEAKLEDLKTKEINLGKINADITNTQNGLIAREQILFEKEDSIRVRETDAENGFLELHRKFLEKLDSELSSLREQESILRSRIAEEAINFESLKTKEYINLEVYKQTVRDKFEQEYRSSIEKLDKEYAEKLAELINNKLSLINQKETDLDSREATFAEEKKQFRKHTNELKFNQEILEEERKAIDDKIQRKVILKISDTKAQLNEVVRLNAELSKDINNVYEKLSKRDLAIKKFGNQTPEEIATNINQLKETINDVQEQLATRPPMAVIEQLSNLREENEKISTDRSRLLQDVADLRRKSNRQEMAVLELETLRDQKALLETALTDLRAKVNDLTQKKEDKPVFPACAEMDKPENKLQEETDVFDGKITLDEFAKEIQEQIASDPEKKLYYSIEDIRAFISGLAMSHLHLLQGISGTGKTSLPIAFAKAVGGGVETIEVQASWRDREDLIGHFNAFENRFHETDFLQAIYKAQTPAYKELLFFIILDEMNLSHPEQYFADLLSALEQSENKRHLTLRPEPIANAPIRFKEGRRLPIPNNVWFVGTANHDETTTDFAPKTYDRSFILELPSAHKAFVAKRKPSRLPISWDSLEALFFDAKTQYSDQGIMAFQFLTQKLGTSLAKDFRIGWGNRLERQVCSFIPVYVASGGKLGDAVDFILATKILRKIKDRNENQQQDISNLEQLVMKEWKAFGDQTTPQRSLQIINDEIKRLGNP